MSVAAGGIASPSFVDESILPTAIFPTEGEPDVVFSFGLITFTIAAVI